MQSEGTPGGGRGGAATAGPGGGGDPIGGSGKMVLDAMHAGALVGAGTTRRTRLTCMAI